VLIETKVEITTSGKKKNYSVWGKWHYNLVLKILKEYRSY